MRQYLHTQMVDGRKSTQKCIHNRNTMKNQDIQKMSVSYIKKYQNVF